MITTCHATVTYYDYDPTTANSHKTVTYYDYDPMTATYHKIDTYYDPTAVMIFGASHHWLLQWIDSFSFSTTNHKLHSAHHLTGSQASNV